MPELKTANWWWGRCSFHIRIGNTEATIATIFPWHGKLRRINGYWECGQTDLDGDKKPDLIMIGEEQILALITGQKSESPISTYTLAKLFNWGLFDLDSNGKFEVIGVDGRGYVYRLWLEGNRWRREKTPFIVEGVPLAILKVGKQNRLLFASENFPCSEAILTAIWRSKSVWRRRTWQLWSRENSLVFWLGWDKGRIRLLLSKITFLGSLVNRLDYWFSKMGIDLMPLPIQTEIKQTRIWHWNEQKWTWKLTEIWEGFAEFVDLNMDGQEERILLDRNGRWVKLAIYGGRFWKRWWTVTLMRKPRTAVKTLRQ